jgi:hypothetical protein
VLFELVLPVPLRFSCQENRFTIQLLPAQYAKPVRTVQKETSPLAARPALTKWEALKSGELCEE